MPNSSPSNWGKKALLICGCLFVMIVATMILWWQNINANPRVIIPPPPPMPTPNARDFYIKAGNALLPLQLHTVHGLYSLDINEIGYMIRTGQAPGTGAGIAFILSQHHHIGKPVPSAAELHRLLCANAPAMALLRRGFRYTYREKAGLGADYPHHEKCREMANCLLIDAYMKLKQDDWNGAMNDSLDGLYFGEQIPHGDGLFGESIGRSAQAASRLEAWLALEHLNAAQARAAARRLEDAISRQASFADILQEEEWQKQAGFLKIFHSRLWWLNMEVAIMLRSGKRHSFVLPYTISKKQIMREITSFLNAMIANARLPYPMRKTPPLPKDPITRLFLEDYLPAPFDNAYSDTQNCLLLVSLALRAYYLDHGQYPDTLTALAPSYLKALPNDPFTASGTLHYHRTEKSYVLYSIGPDGKDDHGTPCAGDREWKKGQAQFQAVDETSTGDIVAGVNVR